MLKLEAIGHLGKDATVNTVGTTKVINFSIAHTEKYKDREGTTQEKTVWIECAKWGDSTAVAAYLKKGGQVYVQGTPEVKTFQRNDGTTAANLTLRVFDLVLLGSGNGGQSNSSQQQPAAATAAQPAPQGQQTGGYEPVDDLPF